MALGEEGIFADIRDGSDGDEFGDMEVTGGAVPR